MTRTTFLSAFLIALGCALFGGDEPRARAQQQPAGYSRRGDVPAVGDPAPFTTRDGTRKGWKVVIPGKKPLATPAVADGKVFLGGGFGSHEFYAFDAVTGKKVWQYRTKDDGPTAAVVEDGYVVFNTESCELEVLTVAGKPVWKKWLGDPLMSMPAIAQGKVYMAYPDSKGDKQHYLACFDLKSGNELWKKPIAGDIITAPVIDSEQILLATLDGTLHCFRTDGELAWKERKNATSAPVIWDRRCYFSSRDETKVTRDGKVVRQQNEELAVRSLDEIAALKKLPQTRRQADYLDYGLRARSSVESKNQLQDANVGFSGGKGDAKINQAIRNLGQASVVGVWSYQGSRPFVYNGRLYTAMGDTLKCIDIKTEEVRWRKEVNGKKGELLDAELTPPVLVNGKIFLGTARGDVLCLSAETGVRLWSAALGEPIVFPPAVARGRLYVATSAGSLICLETGDEKDDGWLMWGANAAHNGRAK
jgi:Ca-activated chloride channel family protein